MHRRFQTICVPNRFRSKLPRASVWRTVRNIRPSADSRYSEIGKATVYEHDCVVATGNGKYWVIIEVQNVETANQN